MTHLIQAVMTKVPEGASDEVRNQMYFDWCEKMQKLNPTRMLPLGVKKTRWQFWACEHPYTTKLADKLPK